MQSYAKQHEALMSDCVGWADFWSVALRELGYEVDEVAANVEPMQRRWAKEHGVTPDENSWLFQIVSAQVKAFQPEVLFIHDYSTFTAPFLHHLRAECASIKLVVGWCGAQYSDGRVFHEYDVVLSCIPELVRHFRNQGHRAYHVNHAFAPSILGRLQLDNEPTVDFAFIGSIVLRNQFHVQREKLLFELAERSDLKIWSDLFRPSYRQRQGAIARRFAYDVMQSLQRVGISKTRLRSLPAAGKVTTWESRPAPLQYVGGIVARRALPPLFGLAMYQQLRDSKVSLNSHIDIAEESASNMRLYEGTGVGTCLLTDWKPNLAELFEPDKEVVTYINAEECIEKVRYLLEHDEARRDIASAGQQRTLRDHTFNHRAAQFAEIINRTLCG